MKLERDRRQPDDRGRRGRRRADREHHRRAQPPVGLRLHGPRRRAPRTCRSPTTRTRTSGPSPAPRRPRRCSSPSSAPPPGTPRSGALCSLVDDARRARCRARSRSASARSGSWARSRSATPARTAPATPHARRPAETATRPSSCGRASSFRRPIGSLWIRRPDRSSTALLRARAAGRGARCAHARRRAHVRRGQQAAARRRRHLRRLPQQDGRADGPRVSRTARPTCRPASTTSRATSARPTRRAPRKALVVFPEDAGLITALIGTRGANARRQTSALGAIPSLFEPYAAAGRLLLDQVPGPAGRAALFLALTDTFYRSFYETFRALAIEHGVYIAADDQRRAGAARGGRRGPGAGRPAARSRRAARAPTPTRPPRRTRATPPTCSRPTARCSCPTARAARSRARRRPAA